MKNVYWLFTLLLVFYGCGDSNENTENTPDNTTIVSGKVMDVTGAPIADVVVSDGVICAKTDVRGEYSLKSSPSRRPFISISTPAEYELPEKNGIAAFYLPLSAEKENSAYNFTLKKRSTVTSDFIYIAISDPQVKNEDDLNRYKSETLVDLKKTIESFTQIPIVGVGLGDCVYDQMELLGPYKSSVSNLGLTMFNVIGNHDYNKDYVSLERTVHIKDGYAQKKFNDTFGPTNYSFNIGNVHIITMEDIDYQGDREYDKVFTNAQLAWLKQDLSYVLKSKIIFLNLHAATSITMAGQVSNAKDLYKALDGYQVNIFSGHTHAYENVIISNNIFEHNIGSACGYFWKGDVNQCGAPNGYLVTKVTRNDIQWYYKSTGKEKEHQLRVYSPGQFKSQAKYLVANVWDFDSSWKVEWYEDGVLKGEMEQFEDEDQAFIDLNKGKLKGHYTNHLFRAIPDITSGLIQVKVTTRFGEVFTKNITLS